VSRRLISTRLMALCATCAWCGVRAADAQLARQAYVSRPSSEAASTQLGRTGGRYTRQYSDVASLSGAPAGFETGLNSRGLVRPNFFGAGQLGQLPAPAIPQAFAFAPIGYAAPQGPVLPSFSTLGAPRDADLARASLLTASERLSVPLTGLTRTGIVVPPRPYFATAPTGDAVSDFFRLTPAQTKPESAGLQPLPDLSTLLEEKNDQFLERRRARALAAFEQAFTPDAPNRLDLLSVARRELCAVRDLDREAYIPSLLLVHVALEQRQVIVALHYLAEAAQRHPAVFVERPDLATYFGDASGVGDRMQSKLLEAQMREHLQIGDQNPGVAGAYALQTYCAWVLNDRARMRTALDQMEAAEQEGEGEPVPQRVVAIRHALSAALR
jgi:hypothetical protein